MYDQNFNPFAQNVAVIRGYFKRKSVLALGIFPIVRIVMSIIVSLASITTLIPLMRNLMDYVNDSGVMNGLTSSGISVNTNFSSFTSSSVAYAVVAAAYIIIYIKSNSKNPNASPSVGFTILFVVSIIQLVGCIGASVLLSFFIVGVGISVPFILSDNSSGLSSDETTIIAVALIILAVLFAALIFLFLLKGISYFNYIKSVRRSMTSVELSSKGARAYGISDLLLGILYASYALLAVALIPLLPYLASLDGEIGALYRGVNFAPIFILAAVSTILTAINFFLGAKVAFGYRKYIDNVKFGYGAGDAPMPPQMFPPQPAYTQPMNSAQPPSPMPPAYPQNIPDAPQPADSGQPAPVSDDRFPPYANTPTDAAPGAPVYQPFNVMNHRQPEIDLITPSGVISSHCPVCGTDIDADAAFCSSCGTRLK